MTPDDIVGKHYKQAQRVAEWRGFKFRIASYDGEPTTPPLEVDEERMLVDLDKFNNVLRVRFG